MAQKIIILTTEGPSREDGNVYYSPAYLVESDTLKFDEDVFAGIHTRADYEDLDDVIEEIRKLGYIVHDDVPAEIITVSAE